MAGAGAEDDIEIDLEEEFVMEQREAATTSATAMQEFHWVMAVQSGGPYGVQMREQSGVATAPVGQWVTRHEIFQQIRAEVTQGLSSPVVVFWMVERNQL